MVALIDPRKFLVLINLRKSWGFENINIDLIAGMLDED
jgi:coproporphyrinogen III oxidase-like Fe-S oxidoreductase